VKVIYEMWDKAVQSVSLYDKNMDHIKTFNWKDFKVTTCCDKDLTTPFCPYCGKAKPVSPSEDLLRHLKSNFKTADAHLKDFDKADLSNVTKEIQAEHFKARGKAERLAMKWDSWIEFVEGALEKE